MYEVGRLCVKTAGRDAMQYCVVVDEVKDGKVLVEGNTRRKAVSLTHLEPTSKVLKVKKGASRDDITKEFEALEIPVKVKGEAKKAPKAQERKSRLGTSKKEKRAAAKKDSAKAEK